VRVARNPDDIAAFRRILNVPARGIGKKTEARVLQTAIERRTSPRELLRYRDELAAFGRARKALTRFAELLDVIEALPADRPGHFVEQVVAETGYLDFLGDGTASADVDRIENVRELVNAAAEYEVREPGGGIDGFLEENALVSDQDTFDGTANAVTLMTVHAAKGLEFPCVIVAGLEEMLFPHALSVKDDASVEEERRLFYVATTRAMEELVLVHAGRRLRQGQYQPSQPSRFLDEIPDELLAVDDRTRDPFGGDDDDDPVFQVAEGPAFRAGDRVRHNHFGVGRVLAVRSSGGGTRVTVDFTGAGRRELSLAYARLERV
jgi:DNA helicase-2/ATP-dependent DNA helicase PcrA